jgi:hypothetical protein
MNKKMVVLGILVFLVIINLTGCIENEDNNQENGNIADRFIGTWTGNIVIKPGTAITEFKFEENTVNVKTEGNWGKDEDYFIETFYYEVQGNELVLDSTSDKDGKNLTTIYSYHFNSRYDVLYIDDSAFIKTN